MVREEIGNRGSRWSLQGMTALVIGGTKGIGYAVVEELASLGATKLMSTVSYMFNGKLNILIFSFLMSTNLESAYHNCQLAYPLLKASEAGSIVFISSVAGVVAINTGGCIYSATKAYGSSESTCKNFACEWAKDNIRSNSVAPWCIRTPLTDTYLSNEKLMEAIISQTPLGHVGEPKEVSSLVAFLCLPAASYMGT
ncbi:hypothetical protein ACB098_08G054100 [Castanea mollissima]